MIIILWSRMRTRAKRGHMLHYDWRPEPVIVHVQVVFVWLVFSFQGFYFRIFVYPGQWSTNVSCGTLCFLEFKWGNPELVLSLIVRS